MIEWVRRVHRYPIDLRQEFTLPHGLIVMLGRSTDNMVPGRENMLDVWVEEIVPISDVEPEAREPLRRFRIYGTGHDIDREASWLHSFADVIMTGGIWHLYQMGPSGL